MFKRHYQKRSTNIVFVIFRLVLSMVMLAVLAGGTYSAYKHFSGLDPLKMDPQALVSELLAGKVPKEFMGILSSSKLTQSLSNQISQKVLPAARLPAGQGRQVLSQQKSKEIPADDSKRETGSDASLAFKFLIVTDSHSDNVNLGKAINQARHEYPDLKFIIGLGDYTEVGTVTELKNAKKEFDNSNLRYFLIPGDHDLWDCRNRGVIPTSCFNEVFGPVYQSFTFDNFEFLLLDNSDDYHGVGEAESKWVEGELEKAGKEASRGIFVFLHEPLFHPSSDHVMGKIEKDLPAGRQGLKQQARDLMFQFKNAGVKQVFAGDVHLFSQYSEPVTGLNMATIGAVAIDRNPQAPRFAVVFVFEDGNTKIEDVEIK